MSFSIIPGSASGVCRAALWKRTIEPFFTRETTRSVISGALSSFLDNAPTYLVFLTTAGSVGFTEGVTTTVGIVAPKILMAVSAGAVFMGANTYIGNAPNFMVKSIAEENGIKMPSFFGYMGWSLAILIPTFLVDMVIFFL